MPITSQELGRPFGAYGEPLCYQGLHPWLLTMAPSGQSVHGHGVVGCCSRGDHRRKPRVRRFVFALRHPHSHQLPAKKGRAAEIFCMDQNI